MEVRAAAAVAAQHRARRGGGALPPLHQPRHRGPAQEDRHRLHQVLIIMWIINNISPPAQEAHYLPLPRPVRGAAPGAGGLGLPPADGRGGARQGQAVHTEAGTAGAGGNNTYLLCCSITSIPLFQENIL